MPRFKKFTAEEFDAMRAPATGERARIREEYRGYLKGLKQGEGGELTLGEDEKKITIKNRLKRAAEELNLDLEFKRSDDKSLRFRVRPGER